MTPNLETKVQQEVEALHEFFVEWFSGRLPLSEFQAGFLSRFDQDFMLIPPGGSLLTVEELASSVRQAHGTNPNFRIAIRNVTLHRVLDGHVLATYEEWQRNALASSPPENARIATVFFKSAEPLRWFHVHETWMPEEVARAGPYDF